jgi:hypothetical protein
MMSYLVRRENFADGTPPPKKPYSAVEFKNSTDTLLQGVYGTGKSSNAFLVDLMQKELDKAVTEGVVTMQEGLEFIKSRKKYYDDYLKEQSKTTDGPIGLPQIEERTELVDGGLLKTGPNKGKYVLKYTEDKKRLKKFFDTKEEFEAFAKMRREIPRGGAFQDYTKKISTPSAKELEIAENMHSSKYNKKGIELWQSLKRSERAGIRQGTSTGAGKGPKPKAPNQLGKEKFLELAKANKGKTYNEFLEVIKDYKTVRGNNFTQAMVEDRVRMYDLGAGFFKRKPGKGYDKESDAKRVKKRKTSIETTAPFKAKGSKGFNFHHIRQIGGDVPLTTDDIAILDQRVNSSLGTRYNKDLNNIADEITKNNRLALEAMNAKEENKAFKLMQKVEALNNQAEGIVKRAIKDLPDPYKKMVGFNRFTLPTDEYGLPIEKEPYVIKKVGGVERTKGAIPLADLTLEQETALRKQIKTDSFKLEKAGLKDKILSGAGKVLKTAGKVIKPIGYAVGTKALFDARALAQEQGIDLSKMDQLMAIDSGDPYVALDNYKRRNIPGYSEEQAGITLGKFQDDFTEVGKDSTFGKYNDQIKNIKLP